MIQPNEITGHSASGNTGGLPPASALSGGHNNGPVAQQTAPSQSQQNGGCDRANQQQHMQEDSYIEEQPFEEEQDNRLTLERIYNTGLSRPIVSNIASRILGLDSILHIEDTYNEADHTLSYLIALRPSVSYVYSMTPVFIRRQQESMPVHYARSGLSSLLVNDVQGGVGSSLDTSPRFPVFTVAATSAQPPATARTLTPIGYEIYSVATSSFSKSLLSATSKLVTQSIYKPSITDAVGRMFLNHIMSPATCFAPVLTRILLMFMHIFGTGSGKASLSSSLFESGLPSSFTLHTVDELTVKPVYRIYTFDAFAKLVLKGQFYTSSQDSKQFPTTTGCKLMVTREMVTAPWFPYLLICITHGPQILFYHTDPSDVLVSIYSDYSVHPYASQDHGDILRLYNMFRLPGHSRVDIVVYDADAGYTWPLLPDGQNEVVAGGLFHDGTGALGYDNPNQQELKGISALSRVFHDDAVLQSNDILSALESLWNVACSNWASQEDVNLAIKMASIYGKVHEPQSRIYTPPPSQYNNLCCYTSSLASCCFTSVPNTNVTRWESSTPVQVQMWEYYVSSMTLPLGYVATNMGEWSKTDAHVYDFGAICGLLPLQNVDHISMCLLQMYEPSTQSAYVPFRHSLLNSVARASAFATNISAAVDFLMYLSCVPSQVLCLDRNVDMELTRTSVKQYGALVDPLLRHIGGDYLANLVQFDRYMVKSQIATAASIFKFPYTIPAQRNPLPIIMHAVGANFSNDAIAKLTARTPQDLSIRTLQDCNGQQLFYSTQIAAPRRSEISDHPEVLTRWYDDTMCTIPYAINRLSICSVQGIWNPITQKPLTGLGYTYYSPSLIATFSRSEPIFTIDETLLQGMTPFDLGDIQNLSLPALLESRVGVSSGISLVSLDGNWMHNMPKKWDAPSISLFHQQSPAILKMELRLANQFLSSSSLFLD